MPRLFLIDHLEGCSPPNPCASCRAATLLRTKLSDEEFQTLLGLAAEVAPMSKNKPSQSPVMSVSIDEMGLSIRGANRLKAKKILTLDDVCRRTESELSKIPGLGIRSIRQIKKFAAKAGRKLMQASVTTR